MKRKFVTNKAGTKRECRNWWAVTDTGVEMTTGYRCGTDSDMWWCPSVGYSLSEKHHIFKTEKEALKKAIKEEEFNLAESQSLLDKLKNRLARIDK